MWDDRLACFVERIEYDFDTKQGKLWMQEGNCCNRPRCVEMFKQLDLGVKLIIFYSGLKPDTVYQLTQDGWISVTVKIAA